MSRADSPHPNLARPALLPWTDLGPPDRPRRFLRADAAVDYWAGEA